MTEPMSDDLLAEIEALHSKASKGPWVIEYEENEKTGEECLLKNPDGMVLGTLPYDGAPILFISEDDTKFIAASITNTEWLIKEVKRLRALLEKSVLGLGSN